MSLARIACHVISSESFTAAAVVQMQTGLNAKIHTLRNVHCRLHSAV